MTQNVDTAILKDYTQISIKNWQIDCL